MTHYFDEDPRVESRLESVDVVLSDIAFSICTDRGVFSHGHIDSGTKLLLQTAPAPPPTGDLLDLGCGSGAIALALALRSPGSTIWATDVNSRARELTALNAERNGLVNIRAVTPDEIPDHICFATIWSNPPIRIGKAALHDLLLRWLPRLEPGGHAALVVHKHLGADSLQRWLIDEGYRAERTVSRAGFRVLVIDRPPDR